jgi:A/G-specific adenine glycosylase
VGRSTAGAIAAIAGGERHAILDGNVRRLLARHAGIAGDPAATAVLARMWEVAEERTPTRETGAYTQGVMDLGAQVCTPRDPDCSACPVAGDCVARLENRVAELPGKRVRKAPGRKHVQMLVVVSRGEVLLQKRPSTGIWGGLWSLPEVEAGTEPLAAVRDMLGLAATASEPLPRFEHAFTHFTLEVTPWLVRTSRQGAIAAEQGATWLAFSDLAGAALPSPVRKLLRSVAASSGTGAARPAGASHR